MRGAQSRLLARVNPLDFFFDRAKSHFRTSPQLILLRAFSGFRLQVAALLFCAATSLFLFRLTQLRQFGIMRPLGRAELLINLPATQLFHRADTRQLLLGAINFVVSYLASLFFFGAFPSFRINSFATYSCACSASLSLRASK